MMNILKAVIRWAMAAETPTLPEVEQSAQIQEQQNLMESLRGGQCLFLDFDGVLHRGNSGTLVHRPKLEALLRKHPKIVIVISSTWRSGGLQYLKRLFSKDIAERVVGVTPERTGPFSRSKEIMEVVRLGRPKYWIALDDDECLFSPGFQPLYLTSPEVGLTEEDLARLDDVFSAWSNQRKAA